MVGKVYFFKYRVKPGLIRTTRNNTLMWVRYLWVISVTKHNDHLSSRNALSISSAAFFVGFKQRKDECEKVAKIRMAGFPDPAVVELAIPTTVIPKKMEDFVLCCLSLN